MAIIGVTLVLAFALLLIGPLIYADVVQTALMKLQISSETAMLAVLGILVGSAINIPVKRIKREAMVPVHSLAVFGLGGRWPGMTHARAETVIAVNVGGCLIPTGLALYEVTQLARTNAVLPLIAAVVLNVIVCYFASRPVEGVGILMPGLIPPLVAAGTALWLAPGHATPVAYVAGTFGPLIGADLLHLRQIEQMDTGMASIGGAGTFDGILLSGIVACYLS